MLNKQDTINGFRIYIDEDKHPNDVVPELYNCINTFPCSTTEYERDFSLFNLVCTDLRCKLIISNIANLMFLNISVCPLHLWNSKLYVKSWLLNKHRSADNNTTKKCKNVEEKNTDMRVYKKCLWDIL